jgi:hypothetical protein
MIVDLDADAIYIPAETDIVADGCMYMVFFKLK